MDKPLIVLEGPTASGKTETALRLIKKFPLDIISADSRQVYRFMDIGTGKPAEKKEHRLIDAVDPDEPFSVADFKGLAEKEIKKIYSKGRVPFLVGGSGLYIRAVTEGLCLAPEADQGIRRKLTLVAESSGDSALFAQLKKVDPESALRINQNDRRRVIRALEVFELTKKPLSHFQQRTEDPGYRLLVLGIRIPAAELYGRINDRCDRMLREGLVDEVRSLMEKGYGEHLRSMEGLGYRDAAGYIKGRYSLAEMSEQLKRNTRRYAKRQMTWFRKDARARWVDAAGRNAGSVAGEMAVHIKEFIKDLDH